MKKGSIEQAREGRPTGKKVGSGGGGVVDPTATILCTTSVFKAKPREEPWQGTRTSLATLSLDVLRGHGSLDRSEPRNMKSRRKSRPFESKLAHTHPLLKSRATESSSGVEWSVSKQKKKESEKRETHQFVAKCGYRFPGTSERNFKYCSAQE